MEKIDEESSENIIKNKQQEINISKSIVMIENNENKIIKKNETKKTFYQCHLFNESTENLISKSYCLIADNVSTINN